MPDLPKLNLPAETQIKHMENLISSSSAIQPLKIQVEMNESKEFSVKVLPLSMRAAFSVQEAAQILGVSDKTVRRLIDRKLLRASRALRHLRIPKKEIERFLDETSV
jgi:excisionase family DNA binding protein